MLTHPFTFRVLAPIFWFKKTAWQFCNKRALFGARDPNSKVGWFNVTNPTDRGSSLVTWPSIFIGLEKLLVPSLQVLKVFDQHSQIQSQTPRSRVDMNGFLFFFGGREGKKTKVAFWKSSRLV